MTSATRAQRLVNKFEEAATDRESGKYNIRYGIAAVLRYLTDIDTQYNDMESFYAIPAHILDNLADTLEAPTLLECAINGDSNAAKKFLHEAGFTDKQGQWLPQYQPITETTNG